MKSHPSCREGDLHRTGTAAGTVGVRAGVGQAQNQVLTLVSEAIGAQFGCILVPFDSGKGFGTRSVWREGRQLPVELCLPATGSSLLRRPRRTRQVQVFDEADTADELFQTLQTLQDKQIGPTIIAPISSGKTFGGVICVARFKGASPFSTAEVDLCKRLMPAVSIALNNALMEEEISGLKEKLSRINAQLLQSAKLAATGKLAASIAHEINNPLQSVQSCIYLVADGMALDNPNRQYLEIAREELDRIAKIVQRLADLYRPSQEGRRSTNVNALLENVLALMGKRLQQGDVTVKATLSDEIPDIPIVFDQIKQVFFNLILNAVEAMPEGGELTISSHLARKSRQDCIEIVFRDSGVGIAPEALGRIFDPFYTTKAKGTGLGLSISHDIIERHGGSISVKSRVGIGSTFTVHLPLPTEAAGESTD